MPNTTPSPVMNMPVPVVGTDPSPTWGFDLNSCLAILDAHDHTPGLGNPITPSAMNMNADLSMLTNNLIDLRSVRWAPQNSPLSLPADVGCAYVSGLDLWYNDVNGNQIQITANGGVAGTPGSIANLVAPASASYVAGTQTFVFQSDVNQAANIDGASYILRNIPGTFGLTLSPPTLGSNYTITLPVLPSVSSFLTIDNSGTEGATIPVALGIDTGNIAANAIVTSKIADANITLAKMATNSVGTSQIIDGSVTYPKLAALNTAVSGSCGSFTTSSTSETDVTNLTTTITTSGRPVMALLAGNSAGNTGFRILDAINPPNASIFFDRGGVNIQENKFSIAQTGVQIAIPGNLSIFDAVGAGTYTYKIRASVASATTNLDITNLRLVVYEL